MGRASRSRASAVLVAMIVLVGLGLLIARAVPIGEGRRGAPAGADSRRVHVWVLVDDDWRESGDGVLCVQPGDAGCLDPSLTSDAWPWLHFEPEPEEGQGVQLAFAKKGQGSAAARQVVLAAWPYTRVTETGSVGASLYPGAPRSFEALSADPDAFQVETWVLSRKDHQALLNEVRPPSDGQVSAGVYFPTHAFLGGPAGALEPGVLVEEGGCLFWRGSAGDFRLLLWPPGHRAVVAGGTIGILDPLGETVATVGGSISPGGGELSDGDEDLGFEHFASLAGDAPPPPCRGHPAFQVIDV